MCRLHTCEHIDPMDEMQRTETCEENTRLLECVWGRRGSVSDFTVRTDVFTIEQKEKLASRVLCSCSVRMSTGRAGAAGLHNARTCRFDINYRPTVKCQPFLWIPSIIQLLNVN